MFLWLFALAAGEAKRVGLLTQIQGEGKHVSLILDKKKTDEGSLPTALRSDRVDTTGTHAFPVHLTAKNDASRCVAAVCRPVILKRQPPPLAVRSRCAAN